MVWTFTYWLFLESLEISVALFDLLGKQTRVQVPRQGVPRGERTYLRYIREGVGFLTLRPRLALP